MAAAAPADLWLVTMPGMHSKPSQGRFSACRAVQPWCGASLPGLMYRFLVQTSHHELDFVAFGLIILVMLLIGWGTHQTSIVNSGESQPSGSTSFMPSESSSASGPCSGMRLLTGMHACMQEVLAWLCTKATELTSLCSQPAECSHEDHQPGHHHPCAGFHLSPRRPPKLGQFFPLWSPRCLRWRSAHLLCIWYAP